MASNPWLPLHKAERALGVSRKELHKMRDNGTCKLGHHYGAGPMTRSRDSYYWNIPRMQKLRVQPAKPQQEASEIVLDNRLTAA